MHLLHHHKRSDLYILISYYLYDIHILYYKTFSPKIHSLFKIHVSKNLINSRKNIIAACSLPRKNKDSVSECAEFSNGQSTSLMTFFFSFWLLIWKYGNHFFKVMISCAMRSSYDGLFQGALSQHNPILSCSSKVGW